jgi:hypothetical protein
VPRRSWTDDDLRAAIDQARSWSDVLRSLGLTLGGSSRPRLLQRAAELGLDTTHLEVAPDGPGGRTWTDDQLRCAVAASRNLAQVFEHLGLRVGGSSWRRLQEHIERLELSTAHWSPSAIGPGRPRPAPPQWSSSELLGAADGARSVAEIMRRIGLDPRSRRGRALLLAGLAEVGVDASELPGQGWARGRTGGGRPRRSLTELLVRDSHVSTTKLRDRLIEDGVLSPRCSRCQLEEWLGGAIPLQLDHIDGDRTNNELENLRLLCPNCHALTDTYCGRNIGRR